MVISEVLKAVLEGNRVTRAEWADKRHYIILVDYLLQIHKAGEAEADVHPWIISESDLAAEDWEIC